MTAKSYSFGYGSLVNRGTHAFEELYPARVAGWGRRWCHWVDASFYRCTSLTVAPDPAASISGLVMGTPPTTHDGLNEREAGYDRIIIDAGAIAHSGPAGVEVELYQSRDQRPGADHAPILQSYVDTVMQGFEQEFGREGLHQFVAETSGWDTPILRDRAAPHYPRATSLLTGQARLFDTILEDIGVTYIDRIAPPAGE